VVAGVVAGVATDGTGGASVAVAGGREGMAVGVAAAGGVEVADSHARHPNDVATNNTMMLTKAFVRINRSFPD